MRRTLLILAAALLAGVALYQLLANQEGFLLLSVGHYVLETSLWGALMIALLTVAAIFLLYRLWRLFFYPNRLWKIRRSRRQRKIRNKTVEGVIDCLEGNWPKAVDNLNKALKHSETPVLNYLGSAVASFNLGDVSAVEETLRQAREKGIADSMTLGLLQVRMCLQDQDFDKALALVELLHRRQPSHPTVLRLLASARKGIRDWGGLQAMLADLKRYKALSPSEYVELEAEVYEELINAFSLQEIVNKSLREQQEELDRLWDSVPRRLQKSSRLVAAYVRQLEVVGRGEKAESRLRRFIPSHWQGELVLLYGSLQVDPKRQLASAEGWLANHPESPELLQSLGRLCIKNQLWGKAKKYFESALALQPTPDLWMELAELMQVLNDSSRVSECYREGLRLALSPQTK